MAFFTEKLTLMHVGRTKNTQSTLPGGKIKEVTEKMLFMQRTTCLPPSVQHHPINTSHSTHTQTHNVSTVPVYSAAEKYYSIPCSQC